MSATAYWDRQQNQTQDISEAMQDYIGGFFGPPASWPFSSTGTVTEGGDTFFGLGAGSITEDDYTRQFSEELRLASTGSGPLQWLAGGYYSSFGATSHVYSFYPLTNDGFNADFGTTNLADNHRKVDIDQYAAFGEVSYMLPGNFKASLGARYYQYHSNSVTSVSGVSANGTSNPLFGLAQNSGATPKLDLAYIPDDNTTVYATVSKGFRPGGPNSPIPVPPCPAAAPTQFGPDSVWNYELGEKLRFFDSRISVNGAIYYEDWTGVQQEVAPMCGFKFTANAGKAKVYGAELEVAVVLMPGFVLSQNAGYTHATNSTDAAGRRRGGGTAPPGCAGSHRQHELELQAAARGRQESRRAPDQQLRRIPSRTSRSRGILCRRTISWDCGWGSRRSAGPHSCSPTTSRTRWRC